MWTKIVCKNIHSYWNNECYKLKNNHALYEYCLLTAGVNLGHIGI